MIKFEEMEKLVTEMKKEVEETRTDNVQLRKEKYILEKTNKDLKGKGDKSLHDKLLKTDGYSGFFYRNTIPKRQCGGLAQLL